MANIDLQTKNAVRRLYNQAFTDDPGWNNWFFDHVYDTGQPCLLTEAGNAVSALLMHPYGFQYHGSTLSLSYINGVCTQPQARGKGFAGRLMADALQQAADAGAAFAAVVPATDSLYFFYDRFGFATTVYIDEERYTKGHVFSSARYSAVQPSYQIFDSLQSRYDCCVRQTKLQYDLVCQDNAFDRGRIIAVAAQDEASDCAMAFAVPSASGGHATVKALLASSPDAANAALAMVSQHFGHPSMTVCAFPSGRKAALRARAMMRIVNVSKVLAATPLADAHKPLCIRVHDRLLPQNNGVFILHDGGCTRTDSTLRHLAFDVPVNVLASILFSIPRIGSLFGLQTARAALPLMLD